MAERANVIGQPKKLLKRHGWEYLAHEEQPMLRGLMTGDICRTAGTDRWQREAGAGDSGRAARR
jgi:hypothetical protein